MDLGGKVSLLDYLVLFLILSVSVLIGFYHGYKTQIRSFCSRIFKRKQSEKENELELNEDLEETRTENRVSDYLTGNASMGVLPISFSLLASFFSTNTVLGTPAEIYQYGIQNWIIGFGFAMPPIFGAFVTGPFFAKLNVQSVFEYVEMRYECKAMRLIAMACCVVRNMVASAMFVLGPSTALSLFLKLDSNISIAAMCVIGTFYTCIGGIKAVIWTDFFQASVMIISLLLVIIKGMADIGVERVWEINSDGGRLNLFDFRPNPFLRQTFWSLYLGGAMQFVISYCFDQTMLQRFKAAKTKRKAQIALLLNTPGCILMITLCVLCGMVVYAKFQSCDPLYTKKITNTNQYLSYFVYESFDLLPGFMGFFLGGLFCSALSSLSSYLNSLASIIWSDFLQMFQVFRNFDDKKGLMVNKIIVLLSGVIILILTYVVAASGDNLVQLSGSLNGTFNGPITGLFVLSLFFSCANKHGAIYGFAIGWASNAWLAVGALITSPVYPKLDVSVESCRNDTFVLSQNLTSSLISFNGESNLSGFNTFYAMGYNWYTSFGALVTILFGVVISIATGGLRNQVDKSFIIYDLSKWFKLKPIHRSSYDEKF